MTPKISRFPFYLLIFTVFAGCAAVAKHQYDNQYGESQVQDRQLRASGKDSTLQNWPHPEYTQDIKPILDSRCVVCHGCYDAPCQLKLSSHEAIDRGASKELVYDGARIVSRAPTRMFEDALSTQAWRDKGFYPVLNERIQTPEANQVASTLYRMLALKKDHPLPDTKLLPSTFDLSLNRDQQCSAIETFEEYEENNPLWGMPYGLPAVSEKEFGLIRDWVRTGAKSLPNPPISVAHQAEVEKWETFFNATSLKHRLVSRYIYEHLYLANLYFPGLDESGRPQFFKMVRSRTAPGKAIKPIATRRPFDSPGDKPFYYRLRPVHSTVLDKTNMPYRLDSARMQRWQSLFYETNYEVTKLPGYDPEVSANPFDAFEQLPIKSRYKFMLDEAQYTISGFIKGPVCRGQIALNVIRDHFWVVFIDPDNEHMNDSAQFISKEKDYLRMPAEHGSNEMLPLARWVQYSLLQNEYNEARAKLINRLFPTNEDITIDLIWDGNGHNPNAALTVFRHFDSATVLKGHHGKVPLTTWVIGYSLLERIHYLLVAGFDVYGNVSHQLLTRLYMDFLRMEAESNFLNFLPKKAASAELARWNLDALDEVKVYSELMRSRSDGNVALRFDTTDPKSEFLGMLHERFDAKVLADDPINRPIPGNAYSSKQSHLQTLANLRGSQLQLLPEQLLLRIEQSKTEQSELYTILNNVSHTNVAHIFGEAARVLPDEQNLSVIPGVAGSYPNVFLSVKEADLERFVSDFSQIHTKNGYEAFLDQYGVRRTSEQFWEYSDWLHAWYQESSPVESGLLDYNRLENR